MTHTHILSPKTQPDFLAEERRDPITGDPLQAGDEIVFCAHCKSAFLVSSWEYLGGEHCGQSDTLAHWPKAGKKLILRQRMGERLYPSAELAKKIEMLPLYKNLLRFLVGSAFLALLWFGVYVTIKLSPLLLLFIFPIVVVLVLGIGLSKTRATFYEQTLQVKRSLLTFDITETYHWSEIEEVTFDYPKSKHESYRDHSAALGIPKLSFKHKYKYEEITCKVGWLTQAHREQIYEALAGIPEHVHITVSKTDEGNPVFEALVNSREKCYGKFYFLVD